MDLNKFVFGVLIILIDNFSFLMKMKDSLLFPSLIFIFFGRLFVTTVSFLFVALLTD